MKINNFGKLCSIAVLVAVAFVQAGNAQKERLGGSNSRISHEVRHELLLLPYYSVFDLLEYKVEGRTVTLLGAVTRPTLRSDAESEVKRIEGVNRVDNKIEVLPPSPMDDRIRRAEYRAIYGSPSLERYGVGSLQAIHIIVKNGHVTLAGIVDSQADKNVAGLQANGVSGVFSVTNNLQVGK